MPNVPIISQNQIRDVTYMFVDGRMVVAIEHSVSEKNLVSVFCTDCAGSLIGIQILGKLL